MQSQNTQSIILVGVGGQGILLASEITACAARIAGYQVKTNEVHGMAQRGGSVAAHIRYGQEVFSPIAGIRMARVLGSFERIEALRYAHYLALDGLAVVSSQMVVPVTVSSGQATYPNDAENRLKNAFSRLVYLDADQMAVELGNIRVANSIILGAISKGLDLPLDAWREAIQQTIRPQHVEINCRAFDKGRETS